MMSSNKNNFSQTMPPQQPQATNRQQPLNELKVTWHYSATGNDLTNLLKQYLLQKQKNISF